MDALAMPWVNATVAHLLSVHRMMPIEVGDGQEEKFYMNDNDQLMYTQSVYSWYKPYKLRMASCLRALLSRTPTPS